MDATPCRPSTNDGPMSTPQEYATPTWNVPPPTDMLLFCLSSVMFLGKVSIVHLHTNWLTHVLSDHFHESRLHLHLCILTDLNSRMPPPWCATPPRCAWRWRQRCPLAFGAKSLVWICFPVDSFAGLFALGDLFLSQGSNCTLQELVS